MMFVLIPLFFVFIIGFPYCINAVVLDNDRSNASENLILNRSDFTWIGRNYSNKTDSVFDETTIVVESNRYSIIISVFVKTDRQETKKITIEVFALENGTVAPSRRNLIGQALNIPVSNKQAQFVKHWNRRNYFGEEMKAKYQYLYFSIKEINKDDKVLLEHFLHYEFGKRGFP